MTHELSQGSFRDLKHLFDDDDAKDEDVGGNEQEETLEVSLTESEEEDQAASFESFKDFKEMQARYQNGLDVGTAAGYFQQFDVKEPKRRKKQDDVGAIAGNTSGTKGRYSRFKKKSAWNKRSFSKRVPKARKSKLRFMFLFFVSYRYFGVSD